MPMDREEHEKILNELLTPDLDNSRRSELLQLLRTDYSAVIEDHGNLTKTTEKLKADNDDLIISNSKLFRQLGVVGGDDEFKKKEKEKSFSETVTLESLETNI